MVSSFDSSAHDGPEAALGLTCIEKSCPLCGMRVIHRMPASEDLGPPERDTDGCPRGSAIRAVYHEIAVCPNCHYAAYHDDFGKIDFHHFDRLVSALATDQIALAVDFSQTERSLFAALRSYELALECYELRQATSVELGTLALRAAWLCRHSGQLVREVVFMTQALGHYRAALLDGFRLEARLGGTPIPFLIAELLLRCGKPEEAITYFERMEGTAGSDGAFGQRAAERLADARRVLGTLEAIREIALFGPMSPDSAGLLAVYAPERAFEEGEALCRQGEAGNAMYVILRGQVAVHVGPPEAGAPVAILGDGQVVGEMALLTGAARTATAISRRSPDMPPGSPATITLEIGPVAFRHLIKACPDVMAGLARLVAQRQAENASRDAALS